MSDPKDFVAGIDSDQRRSPRRVVFVTRRTSAQVKVTDEDQVQTFPEVLFRVALAIELLAIALVLFSLFFNAPLEGIADPTHTPNPASFPKGARFRTGPSFPRQPGSFSAAVARYAASWRTVRTKP